MLKKINLWGIMKGEGFMKSFDYVIKDKLGIHARPAGSLAKSVKAHDSEVTITKDGKTVSAAKLMAVMGLGVKCADKITVTIEGGDEERTLLAIKNFFETEL